MLNEWAVDGARDGEECEWLCGEAGDGHMTLADTAYFPFLERIDATLEKFKVSILHARQLFPFSRVLIGSVR